jgi:hypothetical protein
MIINWWKKWNYFVKIKFYLNDIACNLNSNTLNFNSLKIQSQFNWIKFHNWIRFNWIQNKWDANWWRKYWKFVHEYDLGNFEKKIPKQMCIESYLSNSIEKKMHIGEENIEYLLKKIWIKIQLNWVHIQWKWAAYWRRKYWKSTPTIELRSNVNWIHIQLKKNEMHIGEGIETLLMNMLKKNSLLKKTSI